VLIYGYSTAVDTLMLKTTPVVVRPGFLCPVVLPHATSITALVIGGLDTIFAIRALIDALAISGGLYNMCGKALGGNSLSGESCTSG